LKTRKQNFVQGAALLAATVAIVKVIGAVYKIPLYNILGDEGTSYFGAAYNIYSLLLTLSTAGLPVAMSRLVAAADARGRRLQIKRTFRVALAAFAVLGAVGTAIMMIFSRQLAAGLNNIEVAPSILALGPAVLLVCVMSAYRGYTQGLSDMVPTSVSQIIEVVCKLVFGLTLAAVFIRKGYGLPMASAGAIAGVTIGELLALVYSWIYKLRMDKAATAPSAEPDVPDGRGKILADLVKIGVPIALGSSVLSVLAVVDSKLIMERLQHALSYSYLDSKILYGAFTKVQTLFNLPSAFTVPLTISAIPAISAYMAKSEPLRARGVAEGAIKLTALIGMPAAVGMSVLAAPIMAVLYPTTHAAGVTCLRWLGPSGFFVCLMLTTNAILQAYGYERMPIYTILIGAAIKVAGNFALLSVPALNVSGAAIASLACYFTVSVLNLIIIRIKVKDAPRMLRQLIKPLISSLIMGAAAWGTYYALSLLTGSSSGRLVTTLFMLIAIAVAVVVYFALIIIFRIITADDIELIPKGEKVAKILRIKAK
jgi:stage V sporulation protein B